MFQKINIKKFSHKSSALAAFLALMALVLAISNVFAATAGPSFAGAGEDFISAEAGSQAWSNPNNVSNSSDTAYATADISGNETTHYLRGSNYGFQIPDGSTIEGITVVINRRAENVLLETKVRDTQVRLMKGDTPTGDNKAETETDWPKNFGTSMYYDTDLVDVWGTTWTAADINDPKFGVVLAARNSGTMSRTAYVDYMRITVTYTLPGTTTTVICGDGTEVVYGSSVRCVATVTRLAGTLNTPSGSVSWAAASDGSGIFSQTSCNLDGSAGTATCSVDYTPNTVGSGSHLVTASYAGDTNFTGDDGSQIVSVARLAVTATAIGTGKIYGTLDPELNVTITPPLVTGDDFTGDVIREPGENADTYAILQGNLALNSNYILNFVGADFVIHPAELTVTADDKTRLYGEVNPTLTYTMTGFAYSETEATVVTGSPVLSTTATQTSPGGDYEITITAGTLQAMNNYTFTFINGTLTIRPFLIFLPILVR